MRPIEILLLVLQVAVLLAAGWAMIARRPTPERRRPLWTSLMISLFVVAMASFNIAGRHDGDGGAEVVRFGGAIVIGFGLSLGLMAIRERRFGAAA